VNNPIGFTVSTLIEGNFIGTDRSGTENLGNTGGGGVQFNTLATRNVTTEDNTIAFNGLAGVELASGSGETGNLIVDNSIFGNFAGAIGTVGGLNGGPAEPSLASATIAGGTTTVQGTVSGAAGSVIRVDLYANSNSFAVGGSYQAQTHVQTLNVTVGASGSQDFSTSFPTSSGGTFFTATATDASNTTSPVSGTVAAPQPAAAPDVAVTDTQPFSVDLGSTLSYQVFVNNVGTADATGVTLTVPVPSGTTFVSATGGVTPVQGVLTYTIGNLPARSGGGVAETIVVMPTALGTVNLTAEANENETDSNPANNALSGNVQVVAPPVDGTLAGSAPQTVAPGAPIAYTLNAQYTGSDDLASAVLTDTLPQGVTFVSSTPAATQNGNVFTFDLTQALAGGSPMTVTINVSPTTTGPLTNQAALVFSAESGTLEKDSSQTVTVSGTATQAAATSTSLVVSPNPASVGQTVTLSSAVTNTSGAGGTPSGTVDFMTGSTLIGSGTLGADGTVSITTSQPAGTYPIVADYLGTTGFLPSQSTTATLTVNVLPSTTTVSVPTTAPSVGQATNLVASITGQPGGPAPTGSVTFFDNAVAIGTAPVTDGQATFTTSTLATGSHTITAAYSGDASYGPSSSGVAALTIARLSTTTTLTATAAAAAQNQPVVLTAVVAAPAGSATPGGTVTFLDGTTTLGTAALNASGVATLTTSSLAPGVHSITASYGGDANDLPSTSTALAEQINASSAVAPTVSNVQRFGFHDQPSVLVLTFSAALDPSRAQDPTCYTVTGSGQTFAVTTAVYNPSAHSVTLRFGRFLNVHHHYKITVDGAAPDGLTSASGVALDGANTGRPGSDFVTSIGMGILAGRATSAGVSPATISTPSRSVVPAHAVDALLAAGHIAVVRRHHH
jgi:uncharacterized repeat protein (TIGR01451 family)